MTKTNPHSIRILIANDKALIASRLADFLTTKGFSTQVVGTARELEEQILHWKPEFILYDLMLPDLNAIEFLTRQQQRSPGNPAKVFVLSGHSHRNNIRLCMRLGAADYIATPISNEALFARLILSIQPKREVPDFKASSVNDLEGALFYLHLTDLLLREANKGLSVAQSLHNIAGLLAVSLKAVRVSIVCCDIESLQGKVLASSDKKSINGHPIDLNRYPEIHYVLSNQKLLAVDNLATDPTMHFVTRLEKSIKFNAMVVSPIILKHQIWGVVSARLPDARKKLNEFELRFCQLTSHVVAMVLQRDPNTISPTGFWSAESTTESLAAILEQKKSA